MKFALPSLSTFIPRQESGWIPLVLSAGWADYDILQWGRAEYRVFADGHVQLRGLVRKVAGNIAGGDQFATLPLSVVPVMQHRFFGQTCTITLRAQENANKTLWGQMIVDPSGYLGAYDFVVLDNVSFYIN
jgi:hypothetical protein